MWGIVPAAGPGSRTQPLAFSKELLPVGSRIEEGIERPCAVSEYLVERMVVGGADKIVFVINAGKSDILDYYGGTFDGASIAYVVQPEPLGLCDALFRAAPLVAADEPVLVGLPDTVWMPRGGFAELPDDRLAFLLFPVDDPTSFDAVDCDGEGRILEIQVKSPEARSRWIWGAFKMPGRVLHALHALWLRRGCRDEDVGTLVNAWIAEGGQAVGIRAGAACVDVGTLDGYRAALALLAQTGASSDETVRAGPRVALGWPTGRRGAGLHLTPAERPDRLP